ncbi:MAG: Hpt domain-containing protein [Bacteroidetes bacterium]|nr:Hpt domain-containing protein [Bacteroidota bacterium]
MKKYNLDLLKEQCGDDQNFFNEMLDIFIKSSLEGIASMEAALSNKDMKMLGHYAHKIVSPCRHIDADTLVPLLQEMETKAESKELGSERAAYLIQQIKQEADELIKDLKTEYV